MGLMGAIIGDISGSQFEFDRCTNPQNCDLFSEQCMFTDDTVMSIAIKYAIDNNINYDIAMQTIGRKYPDCGFGGNFVDWILSNNPKPYNSYGNGSAMRVSYIGEYYSDRNKVIEEANKSAIVSHNHPEGIKGAIVTAVCIWMVKNGSSKKDVYDYVLKEYPIEDYNYNITKSIKELSNNYIWNETCMGSVSVAMRCFYESESYESFLRNVFSLDCDCDTLCAIGGAVAESYYGKTELDNNKIIDLFLDDYLKNILEV